MKIPVFVSAPTKLNSSQQEIYDFILGVLDSLDLERRALGRSDYPMDSPLREVVQLARRCSGGLILGFAQQEASKIVVGKGTDSVKVFKELSLPSPWNNLEAGILYALKLPLLVFKEGDIAGGIFDLGTADAFIHRLPRVEEIGEKAAETRNILMNWQGKVRQHYYEWG